MDEEVLEQVNHPGKGFEKKRNLQEASSGLIDIMDSFVLLSNKCCISDDCKSWKAYMMSTRKPKSQKGWENRKNSKHDLLRA